MAPIVRSLVIALVLGFFLAQFATLVTSLYLHRTLSHRAMTLHPIATFALRFLQWITTGVRPRQWVAVHRKHHAFTDVDGDPHSPVLLGWVRVQLGNVGLYRKVANDREQVARYARDLPPDAWDRWLFDRAWLGLGSGIAILVVTLGPFTGLLTAVAHAGGYIALNASVNAVTHTFGRKPHPNSATNLRWLAFLTSGEGLHNNHHAAPTSATFALRKGEIDLAWPLIKLMRRLRLASIRHAEVKFKEPREPARAA